jgi:hypothetical protein
LASRWALDNTNKDDADQSLCSRGRPGQLAVATLIKLGKERVRKSWPEGPEVKSRSAPDGTNSDDAHQCLRPSGRLGRLAGALLPATGFLTTLLQPWKERVRKSWPVGPELKSRSAPDGTNSDDADQSLFQW